MSACPVALSEAHQIFEGRCQEIRRYLEMLIAIRDHRADGLSCSLGDGGVQRVPGFTISRELQKTLQATTYLMLYNLVEATMTNAIDAIHRHIADSGIGFDRLRREMRTIVLRGLRKALDNGHREHLLDPARPVSEVLSSLGYDPKELFSGNLDGKMIKETAEDYGFSIAAHGEERSRKGGRLVRIKNKRNELAHGVVSFEQCGQDTSVDELAQYFEEAEIFLEAVLTGIEQYLVAQEFLAPKAS